jgi:hypothetical protein
LDIDDVVNLRNNPIEDILHLDPFPGPHFLKYPLDDGFLLFINFVEGKDLFSGDDKTESPGHEFGHLDVERRERPIFLGIVDLNHTNGFSLMREKAGDDERDGHQRMGASADDNFFILIPGFPQDAGDQAGFFCLDHFAGNGVSRGI